MSKKPIYNHEGPDLISVLPDPILHLIISHLSIDEVLRTTILSKRWLHLWKNALHFDFDCTRMVKLEKPNSSDVVMIYDKMVDNILHQHKGNLIGACFKHFCRKNSFGDLGIWVEFLIERKQISSLCLECKDSYSHFNTNSMDYFNFKPEILSNLSSLELTNYTLEDSILSAFESCEKLKILKLDKIFMGDSTLNGILRNCFGLEKFSLIDSEGFESIIIENKSLKNLELFSLDVGKIHVNVEKLQNVVIDSIRCRSKRFRIYSQNIRTFRSSYNALDQSEYILKTPDILENGNDPFKSQPINIFYNLLTLSIDLDFNNMRELLALSSVLLWCCLLNTLKITIPVNKASASYTASVVDDCDVRFWETREMFYFIFFENLKFFTLKGFTGREQEVIFAKLLITRAYMMEKMYVICDSTIVDEAKDLLSLPRASTRLSIILE